jgi:hypothetical protein
MIDEVNGIVRVELARSNRFQLNLGIDRSMMCVMLEDENALSIIRIFEFQPFLMDTIDNVALVAVAD